MRAAFIAALCCFTLPLHAQEAPINWSCVLDILCPDVGACRDWDQTISIVEEEDGWQVLWNEDLPSDYELIAHFPVHADAVQQVWVRSLLHSNPRNQSTQMITFDSTGHVVVSGHQPHAGTRIVSGLGTCELAE